MTFLDEVRNYVNQSHANAWRRAAGTVPDEPALVSSFLSEDLYRGLRSILRRWRGGVSPVIKGIFTHQTPKVRLDTQSQSTEMADLMLVHQHFATVGSATRTTGNALLLQAKRTGHTTTGSVATGTAALQFELYRDWAPFKGTSRLSAAPTGYLSWDFRGSGVAPGSGSAEEGAYLTVFDQQAFSIAVANPQWKAPLTNGPAHAALCSAYPFECTWAQGGAPAPGSSPSGGVACPTDFGSAFAEFLDGKRGRPFSPGVLTGVDHWSVFVNTMLRMAANPQSRYLYNSANQGVRNAPRGRTLLFNSVAPILEHVVLEEVHSFLDQEQREPTDHFAMSNTLLGVLRNDRGFQEGGSPPADSADPVASDGDERGHLPMLLVVTASDENVLRIER